MRSWPIMPVDLKFWIYTFTLLYEIPQLVGQRDFSIMYMQTM